MIRTVFVFIYLEKDTDTYVVSKTSFRLRKFFWRLS